MELRFASPALCYIREPEFALSVIVVNFNGRHFIGKCLQSLLAQTGDLDFEIVVVDNASSDESTEFIASQFPTVRLVQSDRNGGFAFGNNLGLAVARGRNILLLNPDTTVPPGLMREIVDRLDRDSRIGVAGVAQKIAPGELVGSALRHHSPFQFLLTAFLPKALLRYIGGRLADRYQDRAISTTFCCDAVVGCFMAMRRTIVEEVGGLDDRIFMYGEEREFCWRVGQAGNKIVYMGDLHISHDHGATTRSTALWRDIQMQSGQLLSIRYTLGTFAAQRAAFAMVLGHLARLPIELFWPGPNYTTRLQSRLIRLRKALISVIRMPERSTQSIA